MWSKIVKDAISTNGCSARGGAGYGGRRRGGQGEEKEKEEELRDFLVTIGHRQQTI